MRISSLSFAASSLPGILDNQSQIARLSQELASNRKYLASKDNPLATQQAMNLSSSIATDTQYVANQTAANQTLSEESTVLQGMDTALQGASNLLTTTSSGDSAAVRSQKAATLASYYLQIKDYVNSKDSSGNYLFAGPNDQTQPYSHTPVYPVATYPAAAASLATAYSGAADGPTLSSQGVRSASIGNNASVQVSDNLQNVVGFSSPVTIPYATVAVPATNPPTYTTTNVSAQDVFQAMDQLAIALNDPNLPSSQLQQAISDTTNAINATLGKLQAVESRVAVAQVQIKDAQTNTKDRLTNNQNALSDLTQVDQASAIVEMQSRQTTLQAAETAFAQTSKLSMFNYM